MLEPRSRLGPYELVGPIIRVPASSLWAVPDRAWHLPRLARRFRSPPLLLFHPAPAHSRSRARPSGPRCLERRKAILYTENADREMPYFGQEIFEMARLAYAFERATPARREARFLPTADSST